MIKKASDPGSATLVINTVKQNYTLFLAQDDSWLWEFNRGSNSSDINNSKWRRRRGQFRAVKGQSQRICADADKIGAAALRPRRRGFDSAAGAQTAPQRRRRASGSRYSRRPVQKLKSEQTRTLIIERENTPYSHPLFPAHVGLSSSLVWLASKVRGASKIKLKKVNKKWTVTVRRVIIFLNISRHPLLICLQCCLHQYKTLKGHKNCIFLEKCT